MNAPTHISPMSAFISRTEVLIQCGPDPSNAEAWESGLLQLLDLTHHIDDADQGAGRGREATLLRQALHGLAAEAHFSIMDYRHELAAPLALAKRLSRRTQHRDSR